MISADGNPNSAMLVRGLPIYDFSLNTCISTLKRNFIDFTFFIEYKLLNCVVFIFERLLTEVWMKCWLREGGTAPVDILTDAWHGPRKKP